MGRKKSDKYTHNHISGDENSKEQVKILTKIF